VVVTFNRSAKALHLCLLGLAEDLTTPVPRPRIRELSAVADGIERLAQRLAQARDEQERLGRELSQQERLAALGRVVAGVAHEVRNPLASIKLRLDLAAAGSRLPVAVEGAIGHASAEIARLDRLVADLLVVSGRQMGPRTATSLEQLVRARIEALTPWASTRGVRLRVEGQAAAVIDAESVARAVDNLLRNAVEASPPESVVLALVGSSESMVSVQIEDRGPGVPRSGELFEPFFTTKADGTGLGLAISRAIARAHGGDVTYVRRGFGGRGVTRFQLSLSPGQPPPLEVAA
jgi:signal transduction histidine kinase